MRYVRGTMAIFAVVLKPLDAGQVQVTIALSVHMRGALSSSTSEQVLCLLVAFLVIVLFLFFKHLIIDTLTLV